MVGVADEMVLVREIQIPQHAMKKFGAIVGVQKIAVGGVNINRKSRFPNLCRVRAGYIRGIVRLPKDRIAPWSD